MYNSKMIKMALSPVGVVRNEFYAPCGEPSPFRNKPSQIIVFPEYAAGLYRLKEHKNLEIIFYFHRSKGYKLRCKTPHWGVRGVFASRSPYRPSPLGVMKVRLLSIRKNELTVKGLDAFDGTPVLDIKPYVAKWGRKKGVKHHGKRKRSKA